MSKQKTNALSALQIAQIIAYGLGQAFSFCLWVTFGLVLLANQLETNPLDTTMLIFVAIGTFGNYYYAVRKYERVITP